MKKIPVDCVTVTITLDPPLSKSEATELKQELMACAKGLLKQADMDGQVYGKVRVITPARIG